MALKTYKPTTPSQRSLVLVDKSHLYKGKPAKALGWTLNEVRGRRERVEGGHVRLRPERRREVPALADRGQAGRQRDGYGDPAGRCVLDHAVQRNLRR